MAFPELYDHADALYKLDELAQGPLPSGAVRGVTIHYSAERELEATVRALKGIGNDRVSLGYHLLIDRDGTATQLTRFSKRVYHAGKASWLGYAPNAAHISVALLSHGMLQSGGVLGGFRTWAGHPVPTSDVAHRPNNINGRMAYWDAATREQELALLRFLRWCVAQGIHPSAICGHDECATPLGRKVDPGGVLSCTMTQLRALLSEPADN